MAGKKRLLKFGALLVLLLLLVCTVVWWRLPNVLNLVVARQLEARGYEDSALVVSSAGHKEATIQSLNLTKPGWSLELAESQIAYSLPSLLSKKEIQLADVDTLTLSINPSELPSGGDPVTIDILKSIPVQEIRIRNGTLNLTLDSGQFQIRWSGSLAITEAGILSLKLSQLAINGVSNEGEPLLGLPTMNSDDLFTLSMPLDGSEASIQWQFPSTNVTATQWQLTEGSTTGDLRFEGLDLEGVPLTDTPRLLRHFSQVADGSFNATLNEVVIGAHSAQWISSTFEISPDETNKHSRSALSINAGVVNAAGQHFEQVSVQLGNRGTLDRLETEGLATFLFEGMDGKLDFKHTAANLLDELSLNGEYTLSPLRFENSGLPGRYLPGFEDLLFSGELEGDGTYTLSDASAAIKLADGSVSVPRNNLDLTGIDGTIDIASLKELRSKSGNSELTIDLVKLGDLQFEDTQFRFDLLNSKTIALTSGSTGLFNGTLRLSPATFVLNPTQVDTSIAFEQLSLNAIVEGMDLFDGTMEGAISGHLPLRYTNGRFELSAGYLELTEGVPAKLNYNSKGMFTPKKQEKKNFLSAIGDRILEKLKLAPENVVEDALSDLTLHELRIDLLPEDSPGTPARIHMAGEGMTGRTKVPLILDTNVNGTTDELLQFLLRIHSLGTPSLQ